MKKLLHKTLPVEPAIPADRPVDKLDQIFSRLMMPKIWGKTQRASEPGEGTKRRREREAEKRRANAQIPSGAYPTRQQLRRTAILRGRQVMSAARKEAMTRGIKGGSAIIRNPVDVDRVLG